MSFKILQASSTKPTDAQNGPLSASYQPPDASNGHPYTQSVLFDAPSELSNAPSKPLNNIKWLYNAQSGPITNPSRFPATPSGLLPAPSGPLAAPSGPLATSKRLLDAPNKPLDAPSGPLDTPNRPRLPM